MTRAVLTFEPDTPAGEAFELLRRNRVRHAPVVEGSRLVGIVTDRDLLSVLTGSVLDLEDPVQAGAARIPVRHVMTPDPVTIGPNEHLAEAARILLERRINGLPVVREGVLLGILTATDLFEVFAGVLTASGEGSRLTFLHAPGTEVLPEFDLVREAVESELRVQSAVRTELPDGGVVTELLVRGTPEGVARIVERAGRAGFAMLVGPAREERRGA